MAKTLLRFLDNDGLPVSDAINIVLNGPTEGTPSDYSSILDPVEGNENGARIFEDLLAGSYDLKFDGVVQDNLSPMWIAGPVTSFDAGIISTTNLADGSVSESKLQGNVISTAKIQDEAVTEDKILDGAVSLNKLASDSITSAKISNASIAKSKLAADVFNSLMEDSGGWGPNIDGVTLATSTSNELYVATGGIGATQLASNAVTETKILNSAVSVNKLATDSVSTIKIQDLAVTSDKIAELTIEGSKIALATLGVENLTANAIIDLRAAAGYTPTGTAYVSPNFAGADAPYFDVIQDAIDYIVDEFSGDSGTIFVYPGVYLEHLLIDGSISLIGVDNQRVRIFWTPTIANPEAILINAVGSENILIQNIRVDCISDNDDATDAVGIKVTGLSSKHLLLDKIFLYVLGKSDSSAPKKGIGLRVDESQVDIQDSYFEVTGGSNSGSGQGGDAWGFSIQGASSCQWSNTRALIKGGTGTPRGSSHGLFLEDDGGTLSGIDILHSIMSTEDESISGITGSAITPNVINCSLSQDVNTDIVTKTAFVGGSISEYVQVQSLT